MMEVTLLGSGGTRPILHRPLTSLFVRIGTGTALIDCGEGTQVQIARLGLKLLSLKVLCITHRHADHVLGLPGILSSLNQILVDTNATKDVIIIAPKDAKSTIEGLVESVTCDSVFVHYLWIEEDEECFDFGKYVIRAVKLNHNVDCYGYEISEIDIGHYSEEKITAEGVPDSVVSLLQAGYTVRAVTKVLTRISVNTEPEPDLKLCYATDTMSCAGLSTLANGADLAILEGMYFGEAPTAGEEKGGGSNKHLYYAQAATIAAEGGAKELWLTHFSPSIADPEEGLDEIKAVFKNVQCGAAGLRKTLEFKK